MTRMKPKLWMHRAKIGRRNNEKVSSMTRIAMLTGVFIFLVGPPKSDMLKGRGQTK